MAAYHRPFGSPGAELAGSRPRPVLQRPGRGDGGESPLSRRDEGRKKERIKSLWLVLAKASGEWTDEELREKERKLLLSGYVGL